MLHSVFAAALRKNSMREIGKVEHWCWYHVEKLSVPYGVSAYEVIAAGGKWGVDWERDIFSPVFSSMELRDFSSEYNKSFIDRKSVLCARHIKSFEERGVGWLTGKTLEPKWTPVFLKMCGYDLRGNS